MLFISIPVTDSPLSQTCNGRLCPHQGLAAGSHGEGEELHHTWESKGMVMLGKWNAKHEDRMKQYLNNKELHYHKETQ